jgi:hypothetical protein
MYKFFKKVWGFRKLFLGAAFSGFVIWRFNHIFYEYERAITKE